MTSTSRELIRTFGAALAAAIQAGLLPGCRPRAATTGPASIPGEPPAASCYIAPPPPLREARATPRPAWTALRQAWIDVARCEAGEENRIRRQFRDTALDASPEALEAAHILAALLTGGELP